jgi:hypothetical protein
MNAVLDMIKLLGGVSSIELMNGFLRQMVLVFCGKQVQAIEDSPRAVDNNNNSSS